MNEEHQKEQGKQMVNQTIGTEKNDNDENLLYVNLLHVPVTDKDVIVRKRKVLEIGHEDDDDNAPQRKKYPTRSSRSKYRTDRTQE